MRDRSLEQFVEDHGSQLLVLKDALASGSGRAVSNAFLAVARARGLTAMARCADIPVSEVHAALADPDRPDTGLLGRLLDALLPEPPGQQTEE